MANIARVRAAWSGAPVTGPSVSTFFFEESGSGYLADLATFFNALSNVIPSGVIITIAPGGDLLDVATGNITGSWSEAGISPLVMSGNNAYVRGVGARIKWFTGGIHNSRRVVGSTFIVPLDKGQYEADGTLAATCISSMQAAANAMIADTSQVLGIWSRPVAGAGGQFSPCTAGSVPDAVSWLRTRRT